MVADAEAIASVRIGTWQHAYAHVFPESELAALSVESDIEWMTRVLEDLPPRAHTVVAERAGRICGFVNVGPERESALGELGELFAIYVLPDCSGQGVGRALMATALSQLQADGFTEAILWVLEDNPRTRHFYELAGWQPDGGVKEEELLGTVVRELRYRIALRPAG